MRSRRTRNPRKARRARDAPCKSTIPRLYNPPSISLLCTCSCDADMSTWYFFCRSSLGTLAHASSGSGCVEDDTLRPVPLVCGRRALGRHCGGALPPNARTPNARRLDPSAFSCRCTLTPALWQRQRAYNRRHRLRRTHQPARMSRPTHNTPHAGRTHLLQAFYRNGLSRYFGCFMNARCMDSNWVFNVQRSMLSSDCLSFLTH